MNTKHIFLFLAFTFSCSLSWGVSHFVKKLMTRSACAPAKEDEPFVYMDTDGFSFFRKHLEVKKHAEKMYNSHKRHINRVYVQDGKIYLPIRKSLKGDISGSVELSETFVRSVILHIEKALNMRYVDVINFSDMGHSHLFYPLQFEKKVNELSKTQNILSFLLNHPETKILYHTAEQIKAFQDRTSKQFLPDPILQFRYYTRNILGDNRAQGELDILFNFKDPYAYNTVTYLDGYKYYSPGFHIHASQGGCLPYTYEGKDFFFDLSHFMSPYEKSVEE